MDVTRRTPMSLAALPRWRRWPLCRVRPLRNRSARVAVIGGGFGGASCARALRQLDRKLQVTLIEPNRIFTACPFSNEVIGGLRELGHSNSPMTGSPPKA